MEQSPKTVAKANSLRGDMTQAERKLWGYLRGHRLGGFRFRRQAPIPPYIVDFLCVSHKLVVEIDGVTHSDDHEVKYDEMRTAYLESKGFKVLRFWNADIYTSLDDVLNEILRVLGELSPADEDPHPPFGHLPPAGEG